MKKSLLTLLITATMVLAGGKRVSHCTTDSMKADFKLTYGGFGVAYSDLDELNSTMQQRGFARMDQGVFLITGGEQYHHNRVIVGSDVTGYLWRFAENDHRRSVQGALDVTLFTGFDLMPAQEQSLFPFVGLGLGSVVHHMAFTDLSLDDVNSNTQGSDETLWQPAILFKAGIGFDVQVPNDKDQLSVGLRVGYTFDMGKEDNWYRDFSTISNGPDLKMSGPFVKLVIGNISK